MSDPKTLPFFDAFDLRDLLSVIAAIGEDDAEFTVQEIVVKAAAMVESKHVGAGFSASHVNQMLAKLAAAGFVYKNRHGRYLFAVPLLGQYIRRQG